MKQVLIAITLFATAAAAHAADVGISVSIGQPGFYGRIDIGNAPQPQLIFASPVVVQAPPVNVVHRPVYLRVPPGHEKKWSKHCHKYQACGYPVYFVRDNWYTNVYAPHYQQNQAHKGKGRNKDRDHDDGNKQRHDRKDGDQGDSQGKKEKHNRNN